LAAIAVLGVVAATNPPIARFRIDEFVWTRGGAESDILSEVEFRFDPRFHFI
jgi:hypothetical protein